MINRRQFIATTAVAFAPLAVTMTSGWEILVTNRFSMNSIGASQWCLFTLQLVCAIAPCCRM